MKADEAKIVSEAERSSAEAAIAERLGPDAPKPAFGAKGNSPYNSPETVVFFAAGANERGARVALATVCKSHDGAGQYKNRGRWRTVCVCAPKADGDLAVCDASDRDAEEVGSSGFYVRAWATHEAEHASRLRGLTGDGAYELPGYCTQKTVPRCSECSLCNYGRDCHNNDVA